MKKNKKHMRFIFGLLGLLIFISACAPVRFVKPLPEGSHAVGFHFGGPLFSFSGMTLPAPLTGFYYGYGVDSNLTAFGSIQTTSLAFNNFQTDVGLSWQFKNQNKFSPALSTSIAGNYITHFGEGNSHFWPQWDINAYWNFGKNLHYVYAGLDNWFELARFAAHEQKVEDRWMMNPFLGLNLNYRSWNYGLEIKFLAPSKRNKYVLVDYQSIFGDYGATAVYLSITKSF